VLTSELMGVSVEVAEPGFRVSDPVIDRPLPAGRGRLVAAATQAILRIEDVGTFAVSDGTQVQVDPVPGAAPGAVSMWLHGTVAALLMAQRGRFALHASVVDIGGVGVAVTGPRRAGKSTTALRLAQLGHPLVTDDVSPLSSGDPVTVHPFARPIHVFEETAASLGLDVSQAHPPIPQRPKLALPAEPRDPTPVGAIAVLRASGDGGAVSTAAVHGAQAHWLVTENIYRGDLLVELWREEMFAWAGAIAARVPVHVVTRPDGDWTVDAVARAVEGLSRSRSAP
jgi:HPr Serine kinase C-terminal domain